MLKKGDIVLYQMKEYEILYVYSSGFAELKEKKIITNFFEVQLVSISQIKRKLT
ncbi:hypothetical protein ABER75_19060 [Niallia taxi]|uniref:hypothetical protein n=1 Tax=Niallia taxi TaxID=2499688 RepID=UPI0013E2A218|nr:hypothetical protein [Niallia taxi]MCM3213508.1 hypothetical protein [Niallia taxi]MDK8640721.1 hypothetical protein [Niallia taxi]MED4036191.1 hypothetical protein [Niallia taxi]MED4056539.1 hypothetical protein [Niallia taxi]MED4118621.1 hypothetical protein [Niallia taxi]